MPNNYDFELDQTLIILGQKIKYARVALGMSQNDLAERTGIHRAYIGAIERGRHNISYLILVKISKNLDLTLPELVQNID